MLGAVNEAHLSAVGSTSPICCVRSLEWLEEATYKVWGPRWEAEASSGDCRTVYLEDSPNLFKILQTGEEKTPKPPEEVSVPMVTQEMCISARVSVELTVRDSRLLLSPCRYTWPSLYLTHGWRRFSENFKIKHPSFLLFTHTVLQVQAPLSLYRTLK